MRGEAATARDARLLLGNRFCGARVFATSDVSPCTGPRHRRISRRLRQPAFRDGLRVAPSSSQSLSHRALVARSSILHDRSERFGQSWRTEEMDAHQLGAARRDAAVRVGVLFERLRSADGRGRGSNDDRETGDAADRVQRVSVYADATRGESVMLRARAPRSYSRRRHQRAHSSLGRSTARTCTACFHGRTSHRPRIRRTTSRSAWSTRSPACMPLGGNEVMGAKLAVDQINAKGGILGRQVELLVEDSANDVGTGVQKTRKLIERDNVNFIIGDVNSGIAPAIAQVTARKEGAARRLRRPYRHHYRQRLPLECLPRLQYDEDGSELGLRPALQQVRQEMALHHAGLRLRPHSL